MSTSRFIIDSRDRLADSEHDFDSENSSSDFVVRLPLEISSFKLTECVIPITYHVFNENTNKLIISPDPIASFPYKYYLITVAPGTYSSAVIADVFKTAIESAVPLADPFGTSLGGLGVTAIVDFDNDSKQISVLFGVIVGFQFIASGSTSVIPFGDPDGFPSELTGSTPDPIRDQLSNCARLLGVPPNDVLPNPLTTDDGFALGVQYGFTTLTGTFFPNIVDLAGDNYIYIKSDVVGITSVRQASVTEIDTNESDITVIQSQVLDRGILSELLISQIPFTKISRVFANPQTVFLAEKTDLINFRITFLNNVPVDLNGVETSFVIET